MLCSATHARRAWDGTSSGRDERTGDGGQGTGNRECERRAARHRRVAQHARASLGARRLAEGDARRPGHIPGTPRPGRSAGHDDLAGRRVSRLAPPRCASRRAAPMGFAALATPKATRAGQVTSRGERARRATRCSRRPRRSPRQQARATKARPSARSADGLRRATRRRRRRAPARSHPVGSPRDERRAARDDLAGRRVGKLARPRPALRRAAPNRRRRRAPARSRLGKPGQRVEPRITTTSQVAASASSRHQGAPLGAQRRIAEGDARRPGHIAGRLTK
jgi:hypothetical protein